MSEIDIDIENAIKNRDEEKLIDALEDIDTLNTQKLQKILKKHNLKTTVHYSWTFPIFTKSTIINQAILKQFETLT